MNILKCLILLLCTFSQITTHSQPRIDEDINVSFSSEAKKISYSPTETISSMSFSAKKFKNGRTGIEFVFRATNKEPYDNINIDRIEFRSLDNKTVVINSPVYDTVYFEKDGSLSLITIHYLDEEDKKFMKTETIQYMFIAVNKVRTKIRIAKKSKKLIKEFAEKNY
ncbi:MAG: hypothetical protein ACTHMM_13245 [Agriterribacter sp.]